MTPEKAAVAAHITRAAAVVRYGSLNKAAMDVETSSPTERPCRTPLR